MTDTLGNCVAIAKQFADKILSSQRSQINSETVVAFRIHKVSIKISVKRIKNVLTPIYLCEE